MHKSKIQQTIVRLREKRNPPISEEEALQKARDNFMKALTECLILARLSKGDSYGYEISQSIKAYSADVFAFRKGPCIPRYIACWIEATSLPTPLIVENGRCAFTTRSHPPAVVISKRL